MFIINSPVSVAVKSLLGKFNIGAGYSSEMERTAGNSGAYNFNAPGQLLAFRSSTHILVTDRSDTRVGLFEYSVRRVGNLGDCALETSILLPTNLKQGGVSRI